MRKDIFSKTKRNIIIMSVGIVIGTLLIFAVITDVIYGQTVFDAVDQNLLTHKNMIVTDAHIKYDEDKVTEVILPAPLIKELINYVWQDDVLVKDSPHPYKGSTTYPEFPAMKKNSNAKEKSDAENQMIITIEDGTYHYRGLQFMLDGCRVQLLLNVDEEINSIYNLRRALLIAFLILMSTALLLAFYLAQLALRPLYKTYRKQAQFIQDASHEMRTPLVVIRGKMELLARQSQDPIYEHFDELSSMMSELRGIEKMNKDLLLISKEDMQGILEIGSLQLNSFLDEIAELYGELAEIHKIKFCYEGPKEELIVQWDKEKVKRCINILLENAIKYSEPGGRITLKAGKQERHIQVQVSDIGRGIKEEDLEHIFERFYRSNEVRGKGIEGSGIGLSLLKSLCYTMGIKIKVNSKYQEGSTFELDIPLRMIQ